MSREGESAVTLMTSPRGEVTTTPGGVDAVTLLTGYVFLLMLIPADLVVGSFGSAGAPSALLAAVLLCLYLVIRQNPAFGVDTGPQPVRRAAIFFACSIIATYVSANRAPMLPAQQNAADRGLILMAGWVGVLVLAADGIGSMDRLRALLRRIVAGATAMAALGILEFATGSDLTKYVVIPGLTVHEQFTNLMSRDGLARVIATTAQPLELSAVLAMSLPLAIHQARNAPSAVRFRRWLQVAAIAVALPMTVSRSSIFGLVVAAIVLVPTWPKRDRRRAYLALLASPVLVWLLSPGLLGDFGALFGQIGTDSSSTSRTGAYSGALPYITHHPWLGQGFQTFFPQIYFFVDNQYLTSLIETGAVGVVALLTLFVTGWRSARIARIAAADAQTRDLAQCLAASVAVAAVSFATFDGLEFSIAPGLCFLLLGCVGATWRLAGAQQQRRSPAGLRRLRTSPPGG
jgi:O-antigen ligase